jgi:DNA-binding LytR/AlgR family response regulator
VSTVTALIADDEDAPRGQLLTALRAAWPALDVVAECINGVDAWDGFLEREPQVCFLDVRMPGLTGIEVAQRIGTAAHVVFVTAPGDHALAAFDAAAVDHVLKPVDGERLAQVVEQVRGRLAAPGGRPPDLQELLDRLAGQVRKPAPLEMIHVGVGRELQQVPVDDVLYLESDGRYTRVVHAGGEAMLRVPLKELVGQLDARQFRQVHRSVIVNLRQVVGTVGAEDGGMVATLRGRDVRLPVGRHFQGVFESR